MRSVSIITGPDTYLDHLGVICYLMQIPLLITEEKTYESALEFYPQVKNIKIGHAELSLEYLASEYDVIFESGKFWAAELAPLFKLFFQKDMRFVFCPHGNSDKGFSLKNHVEQDVALVYGQHMLDLLSKTEAIQQIRTIVQTGNYRFPFYRQHKKFYDDLVQEKVLKSFDDRKKILLYAPTWQDKENPSSFFWACEQIIQELKDDFYLIIKLHPFLEEYHPAQTYSILDRYQTMKGVVFLSHFPAIYPLLDASDLFIGDFSSIGYDYLAFDKPMYFFNPLDKNPKNEQGYFLHQCGIEIPKTLSIPLSSFIFNTLEENYLEKSETRKKIYAYAFGKERSFESIQEEVAEALLCPVGRQ